jgi:ketosteroid isomerase-like protein
MEPAERLHRSRGGLAMVNPDREGVIRRAYSSFNTRDIEAAVVLMAPDVTWPDVADGGFVHGRDGVREHWSAQFEEVDPRIEPLEFRPRPDGRIAVLVRQVVRSTDGEPISDERLTHVYAFTDELIERMDIVDGTSSG